MSFALTVYSSGPRQPTLVLWIGSDLLSSTRDGALEGRSKRRYHMDCLTPSLNTHPEGDWICAECAVTPEHTDDSTVEAEISDGELTDLLAEVDETASISSRLRPSTLNRPSGSADGRHSRRIQSRASSNPHPLAQTSRHVPRYLLRETPPAVATVEVAALHHGGINSAAVKLKTGERRKRAT
ncbi:PHD and RING finger domain-containing protein 1-like isoform X3 [Clinocottus analis]|uniref:PHD and RING finger domain-containing protein 1-like isoform X3 n=1 Tax=Clinocottus analis TaxID=304258 RepID=UPI0035BF402C